MEKTAMTHRTPDEARAPASTSTATGVLVLLEVRPGVAREDVMAVMPEEIRATVQLYLQGTIRQWYGRDDGRGAVFLLDARDVAEARAIMEAMPLARARLVEEQYVAVGPLTPLRLLMAAPAHQP